MYHHSRAGHLSGPASFYEESSMSIYDILDKIGDEFENIVAEYGIGKFYGVLLLILAIMILIYNIYK